MFGKDYAQKRYLRSRARGQGWGRAVLIATALMVTTSAVAYGGGPGRTEKVVVGEGDTLWSIAISHYSGDPRPRIDQIIRLNHLGSPLLRPGESLKLPQE